MFLAFCTGEIGPQNEKRSATVTRSVPSCFICWWSLSSCLCVYCVTPILSALSIPARSKNLKTCTWENSPRWLLLLSCKLKCVSCTDLVFLLSGLFLKEGKIFSKFQGWNIDFVPLLQFSSSKFASGLTAPFHLFKICLQQIPKTTPVPPTVPPLGA